MPTRVVVLSKEKPPRSHPPPSAMAAPNASGHSLTFRSSILRQLQVRTDEEADNIRGSPRLLGYLFSMMASAVMLVSVVQFYRQRDTEQSADDTDYYYFANNGLVYKWKLWGAVCVSSAGVALSFLSIGVHLLCSGPTAADRVARHGAPAAWWMGFLLLFWAAGVHICTSTLSVGESQPNVYFATWIAFGATAAMNYSFWREEEAWGEREFPRNLRRRRRLAESIGTQTSRQLPGGDGETKPRETTYNWLWIGFFSFIFAGAATDIYFNRDNIVLKLNGEPLNLQTQDWIIILTVVWSEVALCGLAVLTASPPSASCLLPQCTIRMDSHHPQQHSEERYRCVFGWRQMEGPVILLTTGLKFWVILKYAAVDGVISGLSNAYFGVWGSFFNGVFCFGTWLRENKNIEYIVRDGPRG